MRGYRIASALKFLLLGAIAVTLFSGVVMGLWNLLMPAIFGSRVITFWQALGVLVLSRILFGHFGGPGWRMHGRHRFMERLSHMTPEEREKLIAGMKVRCVESRVTGPAA